MYPVKKGDIVRMNASGFTSCSCYFIPPKFTVIPNPTIVVEPGSDYSTDEQPVMILENGVERQKLDYDGSPIWERTYIGSVVAAANANTNIILDTTVKKIIEPTGYWYAGTLGISHPVNDYRPSGGVVPTASNVMGSIISCGNPVGTVTFTSISMYARTTENGGYRITLKYTKL
jgi:hypothetical protein